ncbi:hypothetical protein EI71_02021 [Anaeroplasma bactoclasticum]|jgi:hypothetical protein|uniref:Uncharacterized protein n=1 Tax=Anaeroplasma bactoclasticum TaxID=2088 RepID=A0A397QST5_9MOLU|nr:hypothetical protein [Anaeroplasma bactoclasticum]RIA64128.1 hypothetical protein EI71_02021 [Anaeroplasma bactoclasticum]
MKKHMKGLGLTLIISGGVIAMFSSSLLLIALRGAYIVFGVVIGTIFVLALIMVFFGILCMTVLRPKEKQKEDGFSSECYVAGYGSFTWRGRRSWHNHTTYHIKVTYKGESGDFHDYKIPCRFEEVNKYPNGTKLHCIVYGERCYVDPNYIYVIE